MADLRIALAQIDTCVGDLAGNAEQVLTWTRTAAQAGADLVAFPEMCLTGYPIEDLALRASFRRGAERALARTAEHQRRDRVLPGRQLRVLDDLAGDPRPGHHLARD